MVPQLITHIMLLSLSSYLLIFWVVSQLSPCLGARTAPVFKSMAATQIPDNDYNYTWRNFEGLLNAKKGSHVSGLFQLKRYFHHFGYLPLQDFLNTTDTYDDRFELAVFRYQVKFGLEITGVLDFDTLAEIMAPRCGVPDGEAHSLHASRHYAYFPDKPRWTRRIPMTLTYAFSPENLVNYLSLTDIRDVFTRAFAKWGSVIPVSFVETEDYVFADIKIGFYSGDHGDGQPFDGVLGVLAHSFSPESGKFHLDAAERWAVDFGLEKSKAAVDLESVAVHEIGHLLGLAHSPVKEAVMYPSLKPRKKKVELSVDDIQGVQALYGSNPNFTFGSLLESDISTNQALVSTFRSCKWPTLLMTLTLFFFPFLIWCT